jgi:Holliday junction DNA helicase RuvA
LYGFFSDSERLLFRNLLKVSGVGARTALGVLSGMTVEGFRRCVLDRDLVSLTRLPGIGRKTAERLLVEMPDRLDAIGAEEPGAGRARAPAESEAEGALLALGYKPTEVQKMFTDLDASRMSTEELIREALKRVHAG